MKPQHSRDNRRERASYAEIFSNNEPRVGRQANYEHVVPPAGNVRRDSSRPHFWKFYPDADLQEQMYLEDRQMANSQPDSSEERTLNQLLTSAKLRRISISHLQKGNMRFNVKANTNNNN